VLDAQRLLFAPRAATTASGRASIGKPLLFGAVAIQGLVLAVAIWLFLVLLGTVLATDTAASRASRLTVCEALAYL
jgi:putative ABC transport system permease protein